MPVWTKRLGLLVLVPLFVGALSLSCHQNTTGSGGPGGIPAGVGISNISGNWLFLLTVLSSTCSDESKGDQESLNVMFEDITSPGAPEDQKTYQVTVTGLGGAPLVFTANQVGDQVTISGTFEEDGIEEDFSMTLTISPGALEMIGQNEISLSGKKVCNVLENVLAQREAEGEGCDDPLPGPITGRYCLADTSIGPLIALQGPSVQGTGDDTPFCEDAELESFGFDLIESGKGVADVITPFGEFVGSVFNDSSTVVIVSGFYPGELGGVEGLFDFFWEIFINEDGTIDGFRNTRFLVKSVGPGGDNVECGWSADYEGSRIGDLDD